MKTPGSASRRRFKFAPLDAFDIRFVCWMQKPEVFWLTASKEDREGRAEYESNKALTLCRELGVEVPNVD